MKEIRIHSRGGQGAAVSSRILTAAYLYEGKWACGFPVFGTERRGAPMTAFVRFDDKPIREKTRVYNPDCLIVLDQQLSNSFDIFQGIKEDSVVTVNRPEPLTERRHENIITIGSVDATGIAVEEIGTSITNTCMLGAFARTSDWIKLDSLLSALEEYFDSDRLKKNIRATTRGFEETLVTKF